MFRQSLAHEREPFLHFVDRRPRTLVFIFEVCRDRPLVLAEQSQHFANRRIPLSPGHVVALVPPAILDVQVRDGGVVLANVRDRVEIGRGEVTDVEIHLEVLRKLLGGGKALRCRKLVRILQIGVVVHRHHHLVFLREGRDAFRRRERARRRDELRTQRPRDLEPRSISGSVKLSLKL
jgi:hypothetical protein